MLPVGEVAAADEHGDMPALVVLAGECFTDAMLRAAPYVEDVPDNVKHIMHVHMAIPTHIPGAYTMGAYTSE